MRHRLAARADNEPCQKACFVPVRQRRHYLNIVPGSMRPAAPFLLGDRLQLTAGGRSYVLPGYSPDGEDLCPTLVPSPDGRYVVYGVDSGRWLKLELLNLRTDRRSTFRDHACGLAWGEHGEIAYVHEESPNPQGTGGSRGEILVQHGLHGHARRWTGAGDWTGLVWAGSHLLAVDHEHHQVPSGRLVIISGPAHHHAVAAVNPYLGPFLSVVAISPSGQEALLDDQRGVKGGGEDLARLVRVSDGRTLGTLVISGPPAGSGLGPGSWRAGHVIATNSYFDGATPYPLAALTQLTITGHHIRLDWIKPFLESGYELLGQDHAVAGRPQYLTGNLHEVAVSFRFRFDGAPRYARCNTLTGACPASRNEQPSTIINGDYIANPSRPLRP